MKLPKSNRDRCWFILTNIDLAIAVAALALLIIYTFGAVILRYFVNKPVTWGEEFQLVCIVITVFAGAGAGFRMKSHVAIDLLVERFPFRIRRVIEIIIMVITIALLAYFAVQSTAFVMQMYKVKRSTDILKIPHFVIYATFPLSCISMIFNYSRMSIQRILTSENENTLPASAKEEQHE